GDHFGEEAPRYADRAADVDVKNCVAGFAVALGKEVRVTCMARPDACVIDEDRDVPSGREGELVGNPVDRGRVANIQGEGNGGVALVGDLRRDRCSSVGDEI